MPVTPSSSGNSLAPLMTKDELNQYIDEIYPQIIEQFPGYACTLVEGGHVIVEMHTDERHIRAGGTISGPTLFALADMGGYACVLSHIGRQALTVTTNININFMRKALPGILVADCHILKLGKRLMVFDVSIYEKNKQEIIAQASGTYAIPPR